MQVSRREAARALMILSRTQRRTWATGLPDYLKVTYSYEANGLPTVETRLSSGVSVELWQLTGLVSVMP